MRPATTSSARALEMVRRRSRRGRNSARGQALAFLLLAAELRQAARRRRRGRPCAFQPVLPARHRYRGARRKPILELSTPSELRLRLRWLAILSSRVIPRMRHRRRPLRHGCGARHHGGRFRGANRSPPCCVTAGASQMSSANSPIGWMTHEYESVSHCAAR